MKTIVIGLGNPILTDDGIGVEVAWEVERAVRDLPGIEVTIAEASVGGIRLMEMLVGFDRAILIDAYLAKTQPQPGRIHRLSLEDLQTISPTQHSASAHDTSLATALNLGHQMGLPLPAKIVIFAIEVENVLEFGENTTWAVSQAIPPAAAAVLHELEKESLVTPDRR